MEKKNKNNIACDEIIIEDLQVYAYHGVFSEENEKGQTFLISARLETDTHLAGIKDDLALSTDYGEVCSVLEETVRGSVHKLIETVAEEAAEAVLLKFPLVHAVTIEVKKPEAPIPLPFRSVSVKIRRGWHIACIALGSNMGDSDRFIRDGIEALRQDCKCRVAKVSDLIVTKPYGYEEQEDFLNGALLLSTLYTPHELLNKLHEIENAAGRERVIRWGPRTLDLDILLYDDLILQDEVLTIPHVDMLNRDFVMGPLSQIAPGIIHPLEKKTVYSLWRELKNKEKLLLP